MTSQFWVIGGEYTDAEFTQLAGGTAEVLGPFGDYRDALTAWRQRSMECRHLAMTRFTIAANASAGDAMSRDRTEMVAR